MDDLSQARFPVPDTGVPVTGKLKTRRNRYERLYFLMNAENIAGYVITVLNYWLIPIEYAGKSISNSWYIKLFWNTVNGPKAIHIRISDHDTVSEDSRYDYDVLCSFQRFGSHGIIPVTYIRLIELLAEEFGKAIPPLCMKLMPFRKQHCITLQRNRKNRLKAYPKGPRFYIG